MYAQSSSHTRRIAAIIDGKQVQTIIKKNATLSNFRVYAAKYQFESKALSTLLEDFFSNQITEKINLYQVLVIYSSSFRSMSAAIDALLDAYFLKTELNPKTKKR